LRPYICLVCHGRYGGVRYGLRVNLKGQASYFDLWLALKTSRAARAFKITQLSHAFAADKTVFLSIAPSDILGNLIGELETAIRSIFKQANGRATQLESRRVLVIKQYGRVPSTKLYIHVHMWCMQKSWTQLACRSIDSKSQIEYESL
jgi:hypothetical protein